ncbi:alpha/beta fold hydrolase [Streptomyces sp. NPDC002990]
MLDRFGVQRATLVGHSTGGAVATALAEQRREAADAFLRERALPDRLAGLGLPTLVICGSQDRRWRPSSAQDHGRFPHARIVILDGVGHTPMFEDPDTTGTLLHGFATQAAPPRESGGHGYG